jgi:2-polyprenyl-3-methyl-5-hydroxy-6-metoxy-1,4-benzoquinol methylase
MTEANRIKWDKRHRAKSGEETSPPSEFIKHWIDRCPGGRALDVACGRGRNALFLAASGYEVDAIDISEEGLNNARRSAQKSGLKVNWIAHDLDEPFCPDSSYDLIVMVHYVNLPLIASLARLLKPGGILLCEQHLATDAEVAGPGNPAFRLEPRQLREAARGLKILELKECLLERDGELPLALVQLAATSALSSPHTA